MSKITLPEGFEHYTGGEIPLPPEASHVELLIDTGNGIGSTGVIPRWLFERGKDAKAIAAWRPSHRGDQPYFGTTERWHRDKPPQPLHVRHAEQEAKLAETAKRVSEMLERAREGS